MSVGDYDELKRELFEKIKETDIAVKSAESEDAELPIPVSNELRYAGFHYIKADEELSSGNEKKSMEEMKKAVKHAGQASFNVVKYRFLFYLKTARSVVEELKGHEDLAFTYIPNYKEHSKNLREIAKLLGNTKLLDDLSPETHVTYEDKIKKLQAFLNDFELGKEALFVAINKSSTQHRRIVRISGAIVCVILGAVVGWIICTLVVQS